MNSIDSINSINSNVPLCHCHKFDQIKSKIEDIYFENTTCGPNAFSRGSGQKIVSFTFYETNENSSLPKSDKTREYFKGIKENLMLLKLFYPNYIMRLYYQASNKTLSKLCSLACTENILDLCPAESLPLFGDTTSVYPLIWRFLPAIDPQVDIFFSRDLDSRISAREAAVVQQFLQSDGKVHIMRDHPAHGAPIMGGMWGAKVKQTRKEFHESFKKIFKNGVAYVNRTYGGWDQIALQRFIWPWAKNSNFNLLMTLIIAKNSPIAIVFQQRG